ncbi:hypothetical protein GP486_000797 [Trichoglossum hirsutum]|uniref:Fibronectin type-III domain-containing protein n=1 Tax=Trichoglossum hirsutum TaxID=265104 RepID=A0A9P8LI40_9PEZI|nr:hypothetical protein GP486_000797 [Trichoglossum hirsutum]
MVPIRLVHRALQIFNKPLLDLINVLGLELPVAPEVSLVGIRSDQVTLHWNRPSAQNTVVKHFIQVNGVNVGDSSRVETAITVTGLKPDHLYNIRVVAANAHNFQAPSRLIRLRTEGRKRLRTESTTGGSIAGYEHDQSVGLGGESGSESPGILAHGPYLEPPTQTLVAQPMAKEHSGGHHQGRRHGLGRKNSPTHMTAESTPSHLNHPSHIDLPTGQANSSQSIEQLTEILENFRRETEDIENQLNQAEEEYESTRASLIEERDRLRHAHKEKEDVSSELRREVASLDRANRSAQSKKSAKERQLQQKQGERKKMEQDSQRWQEEIREIRVQLDLLEKGKKESVDRAEDRIKQIRQELLERQQSVKSMEEEVRIKGCQIKELEEERRKLKGSDDSIGRDRDWLEKEKELQWEQRYRQLVERYKADWNTLQQVATLYQQAQERLNHYQARRVSSPSLFPGPPSGEMDGSSQLQKKPKQRRSRPRKSRTSTVSSPVGGFPPNDLRYPNSATFSSTGSGVSPTFASNMHSSAFFNTANGAATTPPEGFTVSQADVDRLTGGAPMSPTANALLPSGLLGDEEPPSPRSGSLQDVYPSSRLPDNSFGVGGFSGFGGMESSATGPNSPDSSGSRSNSVFSSPRSSSYNFPSMPDTFTESDEQSINSAGAALGAIGTSNTANPSSSKRLSNLFSFRQRGKTLPDQPPLLGSLKAGQSHSFPRKDQEPPNSGLDPIGTARRRSGSLHSSSWMHPTNIRFLNRGAASGTDTVEGNAPAPARNIVRRRPFNMFSSKYDPIDPDKILLEPSSRPSSVSSFENPLPRPSSDYQPFGWPIAEVASHRSSPLGTTNWSIKSESMDWSSLRRTSIPRNSTSSLPLRTATTETDLFFRTPPAYGVSHSFSPAPISSPRPLTPKLNPTAPTFKIFGRNDAKKAEKAAEKAAAEKAGEQQVESAFEQAPASGNRNSRDTRSIHTQNSVAESYDSLDRSISTTPSDSAVLSGASSKDKESFIQKITRKSSSSKFSISTHWKDKGGLFSKKQSEMVSDETEEDANDVVVGKSTENMANNLHVGVGKSGLTWGSLMSRKHKKGGDKVAGEASEKASEAEDDGSGVEP